MVWNALLGLQMPDFIHWHPIISVKGFNAPSLGKSCCLLQNVTRLSVRCPTPSMKEAVIKITDRDMAAVMLRDTFTQAQGGVQNVQMVRQLTFVKTISF